MRAFANPKTSVMNQSRGDDFHKTIIRNVKKWKLKMSTQYGQTEENLRNFFYT